MQTLSSSRFPMRLLLVLTLLIGLLIPATGFAGDGGLFKENTDKTKVIPGERPEDVQLYTEGNLVVKLISPDSIDIGVVNAQFGTTVDRYLGNLRLYLLHLPAGANPDSLAAQISQLTWVEYAHPNYMTDPLNPVQGSYPFPDLQYVGDYDNQAASNALQLPSVHQAATGAGVVVGVLDGGVDYQHPELNGHVVSGWDYVDQDADAMDEPGGDNSGHGTFVAGVIGLVAPGVTIRAYRVVDTDGTSDGYVLAEAIMQAVDDGCDVINLSLAMQLPHAAVGDAIAYARSMGTVVVAAAGNGNEEVVRYPASDINTIAVAAVDSLNHLAEFSNYGGGVDVCAPGAWIYSPYQDEGYAWWDGTSFAAPFVTGQAALLRELNPVASVSRIRDAIKGTADDLDAENPGYADKLGTGLINPMAAIDAVLNGDSAWISPDTLRFSMPYSDRQYTEGNAVISSTNAPAMFSGTISHVSSFFASLLDTTGFTDGSAGIGIWPGSVPAPGTYYATATYTVDGVIGPVELVIELTLTPDTMIVDSAWTVPSVINFTVAETNSDTLTGCISIFSTNAPASYLAYNDVPSSPPYVRLLDSAGMTPDSICYELAPIGLSPGMYGDSVYFWVDGILDPVKVPIWVTVTADSSGGGGSDSGAFYVAPDTLFMTLQSGMTGPITQYVTVGSSLGSLSFHADSGLVTVPFVDTGTTPRSFELRIYPERVAGATGHIEELVFTEDSAGLVDTLVVALSIQKRPYTNPHWLEFTAVVGTEPVFAGCVTVHNDGEARPFTGSVLGGGLFTTLIDTAGVSAAGLYGATDSVCVQVDPSGLSVGTYVDTVIYTLDGVLLPAVLPVTLTITPSDTGGTGGDSAWASPASFFFTAPQGSADTIWSCVTINSTNAPVSYFAESLDPWQAPQVWLQDSIGVTGDSLCFQVNGVGLAPGIYCDSIVVSVNGVADPLLIPVCYEITADSSGGGETDSAWTTPSTINVTAVEGSQPVARCVTVNATNHPASYFGYATNWMFVGDSIRTTGDTSCFYITINGRLPGTHVDTGYFYVDGISQPAMTVVNLTILADSTGGGGGDSVVVMPSSLNFTMAEGSAWATKCFSVFSSNQPAAYTVSQVTFPPSSIFTSIDSAGVTPDSSCVTVSPGGRGPGTYCEPLAVSVDGISEPYIFDVCLTVLPDSSGGGGDSAWADPPYYDVAVSEGYDADSLCFVVHSSNEPATYSVGYDSTGFLQVGLVPPTGSVQCVNISSAGLPVGQYCDTLFIVVAGVPDTLFYSVCLNVMPGGGDTSGTGAVRVALEGNYPNPFNPETNISFTLPRAMAVELSVFNVLGQHIKTLVDRPMAAGQHVVVWDGRSERGQSVASGIYFYRLTTEETVATRKMLLLK